MAITSGEGWREGNREKRESLTIYVFFFLKKKNQAEANIIYYHDFINLGEVSMGICYIWNN